MKRALGTILLATLLPGMVGCCAPKPYWDEKGIGCKDPAPGPTCVDICTAICQPLCVLKKVLCPCWLFQWDCHCFGNRRASGGGNDCDTSCDPCADHPGSASVWLMKESDPRNIFADSGSPSGGFAAPTVGDSRSTAASANWGAGILHGMGIETKASSCVTIDEDRAPISQ